MTRSVLLFALAAALSVATLYFKSEHLLDLQLALPVGLYFIAALLLTWRPQLKGASLLTFSGLALLLWLVLFTISYNVLFFIMIPLSGGLGAWGICRLAESFLQRAPLPKKPVVITGIISAMIGLGFMIAMKELPKDTFTLGLKAGLVAGAWQLGVGIQLTRMKPVGNSEAMVRDSTVK